MDISSFFLITVSSKYIAPEKVFELSRRDSPIIGEVMKKAGVEKE